MSSAAAIYKTTFPQGTRRVVRHLASCVVFAHVVCGAARTADAQSLFPRFGFHLDGDYLASGDDRFNWAFDFGADVDVVDWGGGRATFRASYEAIAGEEFRRFDVNQGSYLLEGVGSVRLNGVEVAAVWHHVSRHLSDRTKRFPIDWNMIAARVSGTSHRRALAVAWQADARATVTKAFVDYRWELEPAATLRWPIGQRYAGLASGSLRIVGVDGSRDRGTQAAGRAEAGVRLNGGAAAAELFLAVERRVDPYPLGFSAGRWVLAGLRLTSVP